jgi:hypothetical protein
VNLKAYWLIVSKLTNPVESKRMIEDKTLDQTNSAYSAENDKNENNIEQAVLTPSSMVISLFY